MQVGTSLPSTVMLPDVHVWQTLHRQCRHLNRVKTLRGIWYAIFVLPVDAQAQCLEMVPLCMNPIDWDFQFLTPLTSAVPYWMSLSGSLRIPGDGECFPPTRNVFSLHSKYEIMNAHSPPAGKKRQTCKLVPTHPPVFWSCQCIVSPLVD